ncbi:DUF6083 domain-containing protein [Streptomyces sp. H27-S2]|uniref:DUF6083 domain-containing protein n=1 Tax=Streptomyces antarcticus TaxID=2996458 RepID=UPI00226F0573|nr:DUF6083 domain-containing protein [Streptomyces sp. H27-S2]MCY0948601.1 DUF6083 domain-containing protein [Streptomyces sp. H27-S2]
MNTNTHERDRVRRSENGPFLLAQVLADTLVTIGRQRQPDAREGRQAVCRRCGEAAYWHRTVHGRWILIQPGEAPCHLVPEGKRWRIAGDGTALNLGRAIPSDTCRVSHFDVCAQAVASPAGAATAL